MALASFRGLHPQPSKMTSTVGAAIVVTGKLSMIRCRAASAHQPDAAQRDMARRRRAKTCAVEYLFEGIGRLVLRRRERYRVDTFGAKGGEGSLGGCLIGHV